MSDTTTFSKRDPMSINVKTLSIILTCIIAFSSISYSIAGVFLRVAQMEKVYDTLRADYKTLEQRLQADHEMIVEIRNKVNLMFERKYGSLD